MNMDIKCYEMLFISYYLVCRILIDVVCCLLLVLNIVTINKQ